MKLTPLDIRRNEFSRTMRGYNREEVDNFLTMVADEVETLIGEHRELSRRVGELQKEIEDYRKLERTLMDTLVTAQRAADEMRETSQREGEVIKREAHVRAEQLVDNARIEAERLLMEARRKAHQIVEEARQKAHEAIENARKLSGEIQERARREAAEVQQQVKVLVQRRDTFVTGMRAYLAGQLEALAILMGEEPPKADFLADRAVPIVTEEEAEALAALDRELAEFAAATAAGPVAERGAADADTPVEGEAAGDKAEQSPDEESEVLIERQEEGR